MTDEKRYTLDDFDFSQCKNITSLEPEGDDSAAVLLRLVEGAGVALWRPCQDGQAELLRPRSDLFQHSGGYTWGYKGAGCQNLAYAIVGRVYEYDHLSPAELTEKARQLIEGMISGLNQDVEYTLDVTMIRRSLGDEPRKVF